MNEVENQLIIVEGLTGLGKSTFAHYITRQYRYNGIDAHWIHEGEDPHPVSVDGESDIKAFMTESLKSWQTFVSQILESGVVFVVEASFFNNLIEKLFTQCISSSEISEFGMKLQEIIRPAKPALIYLTHPDIPSALAENFSKRGLEFQNFVMEYVSNEPISKEMKWNDYDGVVKFWSAFVAITDALFEAYNIEKLAIDVRTGEWKQYNQQALNFLGLSSIPDPKIDPHTAVKFVGNYQFKDSEKIYRIRFEKGILETDIFMNVWTKLIPENDNLFLVERWHFELIFNIDSTGEVTSFTIGGRDIDYFKAVGLKAEKIIEK